MAVDSDRHLLFGLLALQVGLIDQAQLVAAFHAWTREKARPLDDHLRALGHLNAEQCGLVEALAAQHIEKHGGDAGKSLAAVAVGTSVRRSLAAVGDPQINTTLAGLVFGPDRGDDPERTASYCVGAPTGDGQRFRILRPYARGGLGAVFVALDAELHREVALKQIREDRADEPNSRARFLAEAEITGGLEHPGVVPVYGLGADDGGRPYYAMRFIKGDTLKEAGDRFHADESLGHDPGRRSLELRRLLRRFVAVCDTIDYAHSRGVIHRDLKPSNVIVGKHGETLVVDWGLAKAVGRDEDRAETGERTLVPSSGRGVALTLEGSALGTPAYMSPEQAEGDLERLGTRSDVYSLGATLYYLLTGRAPVSGELEEVLRAVRRGDFPPPRRRDATIDRALEAVCLKAMAHRPQDRYDTPRALSEDLERWMADEPVSAWREPFARRARRWADRNRTKVVGAAAAIAAGVIGLAAVLAVQTKANAELSHANTDLAIANAKVTQANADLQAANGRERQRFDLAMEAIKLFHGEVSEDLLLKEKQFGELRSKLLKGAADFYGKLERLLEGQPDPSSRAALGRAYFELAALTREIGDSTAAAAVHRKGLAVRRELAGRPGADAEAMLDVVRSLDGLGYALFLTGDVAAWSAAYREAVERAEGLAASGRGGDEARFVLADSLASAANLEVGRRSPEENLATLRRALAILGELVAKDPSSARYREKLGHCHSQIGSILAAELGRPAEAIAAYEEAVKIDRELADRQPEVYRFQDELARVHNNISAAFRRLGRWDEAIAELRRALAIWREAAEANPAVTDLANNLAFGLNNLADRLTNIGRPAEALEPLAEARPILRRLTDADYRAVAHPNNLATNYTLTGDALARLGRWREAEAEYRAALVLNRKMADDFDINGCRENLAGAHETLGRLLRETGRPAQADAEYRAAVEVRRKLADDYPEVVAFRVDLAALRSRHGDILQQTGRPAEAEAEYRSALAIRQKLAADHPAVARSRENLAFAHLSLGTFLQTRGRPAEAEAELRTAVAIRQKLADDYPGVVAFRADLVALRNRHGVLLNQMGRPAEAEAEYRKAVAIRQKLAADHPLVTGYRDKLAYDHLVLGYLLRDTGRPAEAEAEYRKALTIRQKLAAENPAVTEFRDRLASIHDILGVLLKETGQLAEAEAEYRRALRIREKLAADQPKVPGYRINVASNHTKLSVILRRLGRPAEARDGCDRAVAICEALIQEVPKDLGYRGHLAWSYRDRGPARRDLGDFAGAAADARRALALWDSLPSRKGEEWFETACARAALAALAGRAGSGVSAAEAASEADSAMALLHKAVAMGYRFLDVFRTEDALDLLRGRDDFRLMMMDLAFPAEPLAPGD